MAGEVQQPWEFWIDVGGTFTDCIGRSPSGELVHTKVLSSGVVKGVGDEPDGYFDGYTCRLLDADGNVSSERRVAAHRDGAVLLEDGMRVGEDERFELHSGEPAPVLGVRRLLGLRLDASIGRCRLRLGTTRGTNALLERKGADVAVVTTRGLGDLFTIGTQARPKLFALAVRREARLHGRVVEVDERIDARGDVVEALSRQAAGDALTALRGEGVDCVAICLLNSYANDAHEQLVAAAAREMGFAHVSVSSELSPTIHMLNRGDSAILDAYLSPVLVSYVAQVRAAMPEADIKLMTSSGGLADASAFRGRDSILSGPAGGVVGFAHAAEQAGFERAIGFDMGGTSTDVSRYDGEYEQQYVGEKAGVRIVAPMLAIETVAAGGGSICHYDGQRLLVGPASAGADPGPACYGRGGPLTVTDVNLFNGKIDASQFPFALSRETAAEKLKALAAELSHDGDQTYTAAEVAAGFTDVANTKMADAIKRISAARGYDPAAHVLVSFGGAAAQHACAIADMLGIAQVLQHPLAGILSAYGMGMADVRRFAERAVLATLNDALLHELQAAVDDMAAPLVEQVRGEGVERQRIETRWMLDLRYVGENEPITIRRPDDGAFAEAFAATHEQLYAHRHEGREIEVVTLRVEVVGHAMRLQTPAAEPSPRNLPRERTRTVRFGGEAREAAVYERAKLRPGDRLVGPAVVTEAFSTVVVDPGWSAKVTGRGDLVLTRDKSRGPSRERRRSVSRDPIALELFNNHFAHIAAQMGVTLQRTALSVNVKERLDYSCAILDAEGNLVANAPHVPVHLGAMGNAVRGLLRCVDDLRAGDVYVSNDPNLGGSHLPDVTVITPVFDAAGVSLRGFMASRAHHAEIGGVRPGSTYPFAKSLAEEGVVLRNVRIARGGRFDEAVLRDALLNAPHATRAVDENVADIRAQVAANHVGLRLLRQMFDAEGWKVVSAYMVYMRDAAEALSREAITRLPDGRHTFEDRLDDGTPIRVAIDIAGDAMRVDFAGSGDVHPLSLNANVAVVRSAVMYCLRCLIDQDVPLNAGVMAAVDLHVPRGLLNPPMHDDPAKCAAVVGGNVEVSQRVVDVVFGALGVAAASQGTMNNLVFGHEKFGYYETICGGSGAGPGFDGEHAIHTHMTNTRLTDPEVLERRYPVRVRRFTIRRGSGGEGEHRGGDGVARELEFLDALELSLLTQRRTTQPYGLAGGGSGSSGAQHIVRANGDVEVLESLAQAHVGRGDRLIVETPGGGGYGSP